MIPTSISVRNFRCFPDETRLILKPVTLLYGTNNSGKSALLRALPLLADSVASNGSGPLNLASPAARGASFMEMLWSGARELAEPSLMTFGVQWEQSALRSARFDIEMGPLRRLFVRRLSIGDPDEPSGLINLEWAARRNEQGASRQTYWLETRNGAREELLLLFDGIVPLSQDPRVQEFAAELHQRLKAFSGGVIWLLASRPGPQGRFLTHPAGPRWHMKPDGGEAAEVLASNPQALAEVSSWYERHVNRRLVVREVGGTSNDRFQLLLASEGATPIGTDIHDCGEGMIQVLPVLTAMALSGSPDPGAPRIVAVEEPESHLHPDLQTALIQEVCNHAAAHPDARVVLETHSEHLLLGLQLAILQGELHANDVAIYWIRQREGGESVADRAELDETGRLVSKWPPGVFEETLDMARKIVLLRRQRSGLQKEAPSSSGRPNAPEDGAGSKEEDR